jgi:serine/threonine protein kinase
MEKLLRCERSRHIVALHEVLEDEAAFYIVMEECDGGQLFDLLLRESSMPTRECKRIVREILLAVEFLHDHGLIHRDIKPENIMLRQENGEKVIKLIDFDTCDEIAPRRLSLAVSPSDRPLKRRSTRIIGTLGYIAPESFNGEYSTASDLFSIGVIFFILMTGDMPFDDAIYHTKAGPEEEEDDIQVVGSPRARRVASMLTSTQIDWNMSPWPQLPMARDLCQRLLATDPDLRISSCEDALAHPWLASAALQSVPSTPAKR